jgi:dihydroneopterin aldolase
MNEMTKGRLCLNEMEFYASFGWHPQEHLTGGRYTVSVCFELNYPLDKVIDSLDQTIDYERVYRAIHEIMTRKIRLIEEVARQIMITLKQMFHPDCSSIEVKLTKWHPPIGNTESSSITLQSE